MNSTSRERLDSKDYVRLLLPGDLPDCMSKEAKEAICTATLLCEILCSRGRTKEARELSRKINRVMMDVHDILDAIYKNKQMCGGVTGMRFGLDEIDRSHGIVRGRGFSNRWIE